MQRARALFPLAASTVLAAAPAAAQRSPAALGATAEPPAPHPAAAPVTAEALASAPRPEEASGVVVPPPEPDRRPVAEVVYTPPRLALMIALAPVRLALWAEDRYHVSAVAQDLFWNDARTIGLYPVATWDGGSGFTGGAALAMTDLGGASLRARATGGNRERQFTTVTIGSGDLLGPVVAEIGGRYRDVARTSFYGLGDADGLDDDVFEPDDGAPPMDPIDPRAGRYAVDGQYGFEELQLRTGLRWRLLDTVSLSAGASMRWIDFGRARGRGVDLQVAEVYQVDRLTGFEDGIQGLRGELGLHVDRRRVRFPFLSMATPSSGWAAQIFGGYQLGIDDDPTRYPYAGVDLIGHVDLYNGDRVITARLAVDGVFADLDDVPFIDLPFLGGRTLLRGYTYGRFRDRYAYVSSVEYAYPVMRALSGFVFTDIGQVGREPDDLVGGVPRVGYGIGLQLQDPHSLVARAIVAATSDGDLTTILTFEAPFAPRRREGIR